MGEVLNVSLFPVGGDLGAFLGLGFLFFVSIVHIAFAFSVWALATLMGGGFVVGVYWLIRHSNLRPEQPLKDQG